MTTTILAGFGKALVRRTLLMTGLAVILASLALAVYALLLFEEQAAPEIDAKSQAVARSLQFAIDRAVGYGIPLDALQGMDEFLADTLAENHELAAVSINDGAGQVLFSLRQSADPITIRSIRQDLADGGGSVVLEVRADYARNQLLAIFFDTVIVLFVSLLLAFEILPFIVSRRLGEPMASLATVLAAARRGDFSRRIGEQASGALGRLITLTNDRLERLTGPQRKLTTFRTNAPADIRMPMFVFVLAEQLCTPFFPVYVRELYVPIPGLSEQAAIALPIALFMLFVALGTLFGGSLVSRAGAVKVFRWGVGLAAGGFLGLALAHNIYDLLLWRTLTAVGYALSTLACQAYVAEITTAGNRTQGMLVFVGAVMVACVCGAAIGGVLADLVGYRYVFVGALLLAMLSLLVFPAEHPGETQRQLGAATPLLDVCRQLAADRSFAAVMIFAAIPAKLLLTGAVFYLTPLYLGHLGVDAATIGRCIMIYYLPMAFGGSLAGYLADRYQLRLSLVVAGGAIAGLGCLAAVFLQGIPAVVVAMAGLGVGQVLATAPSFSLALAVGHVGVARVGQPNALASIRVLERIGSVAGPLLTGSLVALVGFDQALATLGGIMLTCVMLLWLALRNRVEVPCAG